MGLSTPEHGFKSRWEHSKFSPARAGSKRDKQADSSKPKSAVQIKAANGHIFYKENDNNHNDLPHVEQNYVRKVFRKIIKECGLDATYGESDESFYHRKERTLHRLTTHSLRHYAITKLAKSTNGNVVLASKFARHANPSTTIHKQR